MYELSSLRDLGTGQQVSKIGNWTVRCDSPKIYYMELDIEIWNWTVNTQDLKLDRVEQFQVREFA